MLRFILNSKKSIETFGSLVSMRNRPKQCCTDFTCHTNGRTQSLLVITQQMKIRAAGESEKYPVKRTWPHSQRRFITKNWKINNSTSTSEQSKITEVVKRRARNNNAIIHFTQSHQQNCQFTGNFCVWARQSVVHADTDLQDLQEFITSKIERILSMGSGAFTKRRGHRWSKNYTQRIRVTGKCVSVRLTYTKWRWPDAFW